MIKTFFKLIFKIALALGAIFAVLAALMYLDKQKTDYIEIYNDDEGVPF